MAIQEIISEKLVKIKSSEKQVPTPKITMEDLELFINAIIDPETGKILDYTHLISGERTCKTWEREAAKKFGRLMKGLPKMGIFGTETMEIIFAREFPSNRKVTYAILYCYYR